MAETTKKINLGFFEEEQPEEEEKRHEVANQEKAEEINENKEKNTTQEIINIEVEELDDKEKQPFKIREDTEDFKRLKQSIEILGIRNPLQIVKKDNGYRIIEGHRRLYIAKQLRIKEVPCIIIEEDIEKNNLQLVDGNITHRETLLTSELVKAYSMKYQALKKLGLLSEELKKQLAEENNKSVRTVERYLKLSNLIDEFLELIDENEQGKSKFLTRNIGMIISECSKENQEILYKYIVEKEISINEKQAKKIKEIKDLTEEAIENIVKEKTKIDKRKNISIPYKKVKDFFQEDVSSEETIEIIIKALEKYFKEVQ